MNKQNDPGQERMQHAAKRGGRRRWLLAGVLAAAAGVAVLGGSSYAGDLADWHGQHGMHGMHGQMDPAAMEKRVDEMIGKILADGSAEQKAKVAAICKAAMTDLRPLHEQLREGHARAVKLLTAPTIDRVGVESLRLDQMRLADQASKRISVAVADAAEVLSPEQRVRLADHLERHMH